MRLIRNLILTPTGLAFAVVQWIVVAFAMLGDDPAPGFGNTTALMQYLSFLNSPALFLTGIIWNLISNIGADGSMVNYALTALAAFFVSLQWLLIGSGIGVVVREIKAANGTDELYVETISKMELNKRNGRTGPHSKVVQADR